MWPTRSVIVSFRFVHKRIDRAFNYLTIVEGFPHPFTRQSFYSKDRSTQSSRFLVYYAVIYGHERGIFRTWVGCWARIADYPGNAYKATNNYEEAKLWPLFVSLMHLPTTKSSAASVHQPIIRSHPQAPPITRHPHPTPIQRSLLVNRTSFLLVALIC